MRTRRWRRGGRGEGQTRERDAGTGEGQAREREGETHGHSTKQGRGSYVEPQCCLASKHYRPVLIMIMFDNVQQPGRVMGMHPAC